MDQVIRSADKYELLKDDAIIVENVTLYRIKALKDSKFFKTGDIGGYIEKIQNLSIFNGAWVSGDAQIYGQKSIITILDIGSERGCLTIH